MRHILRRLFSAEGGSGPFETGSAQAASSQLTLEPSPWKGALDSVGRSRWIRATTWGLRWILWPLLKWGSIVALPFVLLMRVSLYAYLAQWPLPVAMGGGFLAAFVVLLLYVGWGYVRYSGDPLYRGAKLRNHAIMVFVVLSIFQGYVLMAPDGTHVQSEAVRAEYGELHPLLRSGVAIGLFFDDHLLITDLSRRPSDYAKMGLPLNSRSLHYPQKDGYVHAVDVHTRSHSAIRNVLLRAYFAGLGFRTLRHVGTADHLHVALPVPGNDRVDVEEGSRGEK